MLDNLPADPVDRLRQIAVDREVAEALFDDAYESAYFDARLEGLLDVAIALDLHSRKRIMHFTRTGNERRGRSIRWGDGRG